MVKDYPPKPPPPPKKKKKKNNKKTLLDHYLHHDLGMPPLLWCFFAHLLILEYPDHHQNLISSSLYYPGPLHKISSQSVHNFLSNIVHRQTDRQTTKPSLSKDSIFILSQFMNFDCYYLLLSCFLIAFFYPQVH